MSTEIKTPDKKELAKFVIDHAEELQDNLIHIRKKDGQFLAEYFRTEERST